MSDSGMTKAAKKKILVVDDERVIADTLTIILNQAGFEAAAAYTGKSAVESARASRPDLVIRPGTNRK